MTVTLQMIPIPRETRTPTLSWPTRFGFAELAPNPYTKAEMISASDDMIKFTVITATSMMLHCLIWGSPSLFGVMATSSRTGVIKSRTLISYEAGERRPLLQSGSWLGQLVRRAGVAGHKRK